MKCELPIMGGYLLHQEQKAEDAQRKAEEEEKQRFLNLSDREKVINIGSGIISSTSKLLYSTQWAPQGAWKFEDRGTFWNH